MKLTQIRKREQLPPEFSLGKYKEIARFDMEEWALHLERRVLCKLLLGKGEKKFARLEEAKAYAQRLLSEPISLKKESGLNKNLYTSHVWSLNVIEAYCHGPDFTSEKEAKYVKLFQKYDRAPGSLTDEEYAALDQPLWKMHEEIGIDDEYRVSVSVELHGSEEKIISDFKKWLKDIRTSREVKLQKEKITKDDLESWHRYAVLPYFDLTNWAASQGAEISQPVLGRALFPDEYDVDLTERIRKVVSPYAQKIGNSAFCNALMMQALADIAESTKGNITPER